MSTKSPAALLRQVLLMSNKIAVLVTGGAGYIGSQTCKALASAGYLPITLDNLSTGAAHLVKWGPLEVGDVRDVGLTTKLLRQYEVKAVIHFAADAYVGESVIDPLKYYSNNVVGMLALTQAMVQVGVSKSSSLVRALHTGHPRRHLSSNLIHKYQ
jgi:UDP-arabinose 4-epimerase